MESIGDWQEMMFRWWIWIQKKVEVSAGHRRLVRGHRPLCGEPVDTTTGLWITPWGDGDCQHGPSAFSRHRHLALGVRALPWPPQWFLHAPCSEYFGKEEGARKPAVHDDCAVHDGFWLSSWRNNGQLVRIWFSYMCSGRCSWRKGLGIAGSDFVKMYAHP